MIGSEFGRYKVVERLGAGGMGEVYRAEDTTLGRAVALKFLAAHLLNDEEAKQRFLREARAAAALHHPNICTVFEVAEEGGKTFLAMAYLEGESLEERIAKGPLPLRDALDIGRQIAEGLKAAHEKGIVHRDIKPANIMVDAEGRATILDFGLARLTKASKLTRADQTVGTAAYMSPEQIQGAEVDHRTDVWALGCVLYEMVAGVRPFKGQYDQALAYEIVHEEPEPLTGVRAGLPLELDIFVGKCLAKQAADRYDSATELAKDLRTLGEKLKSGRSTILRASPATAVRTPSPADPLPPGAAIVERKGQRFLQGLAAVLAIAFLGLLAIHFTEATPERAVTRFSFAPEWLTQLQISPNGKYILYVAGSGAERSLWLRSLNDETARKLPGTDGAVDGFWSPDSLSVGFAVLDPGRQLKRVAIEGGSPITLCELPAQDYFLGGTWSPDGERIAFSSGLKLYEVASRGGREQLLFDASSEPRPVALYPHFLPTGDGPPALVYSAAITPADRRVAVLNLATGERRELGPGTAPVYSLDGYLIHGAASSVEPGLWALPFSLSTLEATGDAFPINTAGFRPSVSHDGTLAYGDQAAIAPAWTLAWRNRAGDLLETVGQPQVTITQPELSPDGQRVAVSSREGGNDDIWIQDLSRSTKTRLTFEDQSESEPVWSPSGREVAYGVRGSPRRVMRRMADGTGEPVVVVEQTGGLGGMFPSSWSRDGRYLTFHQRSAATAIDILYVELEADGTVSEPVAFLSTPSNESGPKLSPDGRFLAYTADESGRDEVYVRPFPSGSGKWQASTNGGMMPRWRGDGKELYFVEGTALMAVSVSTEPAFTLGRPQSLFEDSSVAATREGGYDVSEDGQRFLTIAPVEGAEEEAPPKIRVVLNWYEEFRDRKQD